MEEEGEEVAVEEVLRQGRPGNQTVWDQRLVLLFYF